MFIVALTGGIGSGKTEAAHIFSSLDVPIVDLDIISHQLTGPEQPLVTTIINCFGHEYATENGALDRQKMRQLVFNNSKARKQLNAIVHPAIYEEAVKQMQALKQHHYIILSVPLLTENSEYIPLIDRILAIDCNEETQIERVKRRNHLSETEIKKIIATQIPRHARLKIADDIIKNDENIEELRLKIEKLHQKYIKTCIVNKTIS